ncbi:MAG: YvcK family protein [Chloroflexi bacterium]|nr:MAG: YvcK family protein [Chloroflexota bacterium]TMG22002.1 MAG: YvcK family protein [Chloroflexota bacterium]TMG67270.1 MAG: YvcK family protein [Chloroflexota bacterium]
MARRLPSTTSWLRWLTPGLQIKRWLVLLMVSELVLVLGVAYALKELYQTAHLPGFFFYLTLQFLPYWARAIIFGIFGVGLLLVSYLKLTQSILGPFLPGNSTSSVLEVIHAYRLRGRGPRVVAIGGGTGLSSLLRGLKIYTSNLSAIVTVADDGGSSGRLRDEYRILPPGDFRQCLIALADAEPLMKQLFDHRFKEGSLNGHAFGNLFIMAMADVTGNFEQALRESGKVLAVKGTIVPSTLQDVTLVASINGGTVEGESKIPKQNAPISHVFLKPDGVQVNPEAVQAILNAELIIAGPGSLYTSILPNLLVEGMVEAIKASPALKLYICNLAAQPGETDGYGVADYLRVIREHVGANLFDFVLVNSNVSHAPTGGQDLVIFRPSDSSKHPEVRFIASDVVNVRIPSHHDSEKLARSIMRKVWQA